MEQKAKGVLENWQRVLGKGLGAIEKQCGENIRKTGFAANSYFTMADCVLLTWLSSNCKNVMFEKGLHEITEKYPWVDMYWNKHNTGRLKEHFHSRMKSFA